MKITCMISAQKRNRLQCLGKTAGGRQRPRALSAAAIFLSFIMSVLMMPSAAESASWLDKWNNIKKQGEQVYKDTIEVVTPSSEEQPKQQSKPAAKPRQFYSKAQVHEAQRILTELGYKPGPIDGIYGAATAKAIRAYQADYGLEQTGESTDQLLAHMTYTLGSKPATATSRAPAQAGAGQPGSNTPPSGTGMVLHAPDGAAVSASPMGGAKGAGQPSISSNRKPPSQAVGDAHGYAVTAGDLGLEVIHGKPVIAGREHYVLTREQIAATFKFMALVELGLDPDLLESNAACFARTFLPANAWNNYLATGHEANTTPGHIIYKPMMSGTGEIINWKGNNEFARQRSREAFHAEHGASLHASAISLPIEALMINEVVLRPYDGKAGGFDIGFKELNAGSTRLDAYLAARGVHFPRGICTDYSKDRFLEFPPAVVLPEIWAMDASRAENVLERLVERRVFIAFTLKLSEIPLMKMDHNYLKLSQDSNRVPVWSELVSVAIYEDAGLERLIEKLPFQKAEEPILLTGVPESPQFPDSLTIDGATLALALLRDHGDVLSEEAWYGLMVHQASLDKSYYARRHQRYTSGGSIHRETAPDYAGNHTPFFPNGFDTSGGFKFSDMQLSRFKEWAKLRATHLPNELIFRTEIANTPPQPVTLNLPVTKQHDSTGFIDALVSQGYSIEQILRADQDPVGVEARFNTDYLAGPGTSRKPALILPNIAANYHPPFSDRNLRQIFEGTPDPWAKRLVEILLRTGSSEILPVKDRSEIFALQVTPTRLRSYNQEGTAVLFEHSYGIAALDPQRLDVATPKIMPPVGKALPLTAEVMDLLTVKYLPDYVSDKDFRQMMLARWEYEASIPPRKGEPDWGRFFIPGKPKPDVSQLLALTNRFKTWTVKRAAALPDKLRLYHPHVRLQADAPLPVFASGIYQLGNLNPNDVRGRINTCKSEVRSHPALAQACDYLDNVYNTTPSIYPFGLGHQMTGPRLSCNSALGYGQRDIYCQARQAQFDKVRHGGFEPGFREIFVYNKEIFFPGTESEILSLKNPNLILDVRVTGARAQDAPLPAPFIEALKRYDAFRESLGLRKISTRLYENDKTETTTYFVFNAEVLSAKLVKHKTMESIKNLNLRAARTPDIEALALKDTLTGTPDAPFGPEIVGLRLGMTFDEAEKAIRSHMKVGRILTRDRARDPDAVTGNIQKFSSSRIYVAADESEFIILYDEPPAAPGVVIGITRQINFPPGQITAAAALAQIRGKYGREDWTGQHRGIGWGKGLQVTTINDGGTHQCLPVTGNARSDYWIEEDGAQTKWRPVSGHAIPNMQMYGNASGRNCGAVLSMEFDAMNSRKAKDRLVLQLTDPNRYMKLYDESKRLIKSGEGSVGDIPTVPAIKF